MAVYIEIAKHSNQKYEFSDIVNDLILDRVLPHPFSYPFSYGFCPNTLEGDGDEMDVLVISERVYPPRTFLYGRIVGALLMEDEKGNDTKLLVVPWDDLLHTQISPCDLEKVSSFFRLYKTNDPKRWSRVFDVVSAEEATKLYYQAIRQYLDACDAKK